MKRKEISRWAAAGLLAVMMLGLVLAGCQGRPESGTEEFDTEVYVPEYAKGFRILQRAGGESTLLETLSPWQGADSTAVTRLLILRGDEQAPANFRGQAIRGEARRIVCMSSSHIAMLEALGETGRVKGVSCIDYISNPRIQAGRDSIPDVGYEADINYELLLSLRPDLVLLYGVNSANPMVPKLEELGVPYAYIGDYLEEDPLGKAEWMVAIGEIVGKRGEAEEHFSGIPARYNSLKALAAKADHSPIVMLNTPYADSWVMPSTQSYGARLIQDAGGRLAYDKAHGNASVPIDMEEAYQLTSGSDFWLNTGQLKTLEELTRAYPKFAGTRPVASGQVWNNNLRTTATGGNDYWESGIMNPDLILQDLIQILHPELLEGSEFSYYKQLK